MAAAEARAVWQRTANRCFLQEDAKRAPRLACCQSSSLGSKQADAGSTTPEDSVDHPVPGFMPFNSQPSFRNLPLDTRWWLQVQPSHGFLKRSPSEQISASETDVEALKSDSGSWRSKSDGVKSVKQDDLIDATCSKTIEALLGINNGIKGMKGVDSMSSYDFVESDSFGNSFSKQTNDLEFDEYSQWVESGKSEPWWRTSDKDELASFISRKSLDHVENCDLPPPQKIQVTRHPYSPVTWLEPHSSSEPSVNLSSQSLPIVNSASQKLTNPDSDQSFGMKWGSDSVDGGRFTYGSEKSSSKYSYATAEEDRKAPSVDGCEMDSSKAQLLEALCHSQTRARKSEKAAMIANCENEHIIKLFFKQASQLFAYKQWFQLLQLESIYLQVKDRDDESPVSTFFQETSPQTLFKGTRLRRNRSKAAKGRRSNHGEARVDVTKYAVAIALGFGLVGAGFCLGWAVGWMLPPF